MASVPPIDERYRQPHHHYPEAVFVNAPRDSSISRMTVPAYVTIGGFIAIGTVCLTIGMGYMALVNKIDGVPQVLGTKIESITKEFTQRMDYQSGRVDRLEHEIERRTQDRFTYTDHNRWCKTAELVNTANGWKCPDTETGAPRMQFAPSLRGWETGGKK